MRVLSLIKPEQLSASEPNFIMALFWVWTIKFFLVEYNPFLSYWKGLVPSLLCLYDLFQSPYTQYPHFAALRMGETTGFSFTIFNHTNSGDSTIVSRRILERLFCTPLCKASTYDLFVLCLINHKNQTNDILTSQIGNYI